LTYANDLRRLDTTRKLGGKSIPLRISSKSAELRDARRPFHSDHEQDGELRELPPDQYVVNTGQEIDVVLDAAGKAVEKQMPGSRYSLVAMPSAKPLHLRQRRGRFLERLGPDMGWKPRICQNTLRYGPFASS